MPQSYVGIYQDTSNHNYTEPHYGVRYVFSSDYTDEDIKKLNAICDTIVFKEHHCHILGMYPDYGIKFTKPNIREHNVIFRECPLNIARKAANQIAKYLNVDVEAEFLSSSNIITLGGAICAHN